MKHLKSLVEFMSEATKELIWMNQREDPEVSRDWARADLDLSDLQVHGEVLAMLDTMFINHSNKQYVSGNRFISRPVN